MDTFVILDPKMQLGAGAALAGILSHLSFFIYGEHHREAQSIARFYILAIAALFLVIQRLLQTTYQHAAILTAVTVLSYFSSLVASIFIYRVVFHRLRKFPGPFLIRLSKLYHVWLNRDLQNYKLMHKMHQTYGEFVRTGPNELSITAPEIVEAVFAPGSKCTKAPWYDMTLPTLSMHQTRDKTLHDRRRRLWDRGFSSKALRDYESRVEGYTSKLLDQLASTSGRPVNAKDWFNFFSFDVMGDLAFGKSFDMLQDGKQHETLTLLHKGITPVGFLSSVPWAFALFANVPGLGASYQKFQVFCKEQANERKKMNVEVPDIMSWLLEAGRDSSRDAKMEEELLTGDSRLIIVAGSDTTSTALTHVFYYLARYPEHVQKLREELDPVLASTEAFHPSMVQTAKHLNGVINETLRLHPPVPSGVLRVSPPEGLVIAGTQIPGSITLSVPPYTIGRSEKCFVQPEQFVPERFYSNPEMIKEPRAFAPFSLGPYACIGKQLALMELRSVITQIISRFDVRFAPGEDGTGLIETSVDVFTMGLADLNLIFEGRKDLNTQSG